MFNGALTYDLTGNRLTLAIGANSYSNTIAATSNRLSSTSGPAPVCTNTFDASGNLTGDGTGTYVYSDRGRLTSATRAGATVPDENPNALGAFSLNI